MVSLVGNGFFSCVSVCFNLEVSNDSMQLMKFFWPFSCWIAVKIEENNLSLDVLLNTFYFILRIDIEIHAKAFGIHSEFINLNTSGFYANGLPAWRAPTVDQQE